VVKKELQGIHLSSGYSTGPTGGKMPPARPQTPRSCPHAPRTPQHAPTAPLFEARSLPWIDPSFSTHKKTENQRSFENNTTLSSKQNTPTIASPATTTYSKPLQNR
jgi:hypothetical protein